MREIVRSMVGMESIFFFYVVNKGYFCNQLILLGSDNVVNRKVEYLVVGVRKEEIF